MLIDTHAHLQWKDFRRDLAQVLARAKEEGVGLIINIGADMESNRRGIEIARSHDFIYTTVGVHPHDVGGMDDSTYDLMRSMLTMEKVVALGEIGLDYYRDRSPRDLQQRWFREQIRLAHQVELPLVIHCRDAHQDVLQILKEEGGQKLRGVFHCFSGDERAMEECLALGFYISLAGPVTFPNASKLRRVTKLVPTERLLIETDSPYLAPQPVRGKRNEPAYVRHVAEKVAELKSLAVEDVERIVSLNVFNLFGIGNPDLKGKIAYKTRNSLYLNLTNECTSDCTFCHRTTHPFVKGHNLKLEKEPTVDELWEAILTEKSHFDEVVFCGYGEPTLRLDVIKELSLRIRKDLGRKVRIRLNTNGHGNLIHKRNVLPELAGLVDSLSVSLNTHSAERYHKLCRPQFGPNTYDEVKRFILEAKNHIPEVGATVVDIPSAVDLEECRRVAEEELRVSFRPRNYNVLG